MQPDQLGLKGANLRKPQTLNRYAYAGNDPVNFVDPSGLDEIPWMNCNNCSVTIIGNNNSGSVNTVPGIIGGDVNIGILLDGGEGGDEGGGGYIEDPFKKCLDKYLSSDTPGGKSKPKEEDVYLLYWFTGGFNNDLAFMMAIWARESNFQRNPKGDHGPMQLTSWWKDYSDRNKLNLIVPGAYDSFPRSAGSPNREKAFTGDVNANFQTFYNILRYSRDTLGQTYNQVAYGYGPGPTDEDRKKYAREVFDLYALYDKFIYCLETGN
jgi:hypothetical protein